MKHDAALLARFDEVLRLVGTGRGDVGIVRATNPQAYKVKAVLDAAGALSVSLGALRGQELRHDPLRDDQAIEWP